MVQQPLPADYQSLSDQELADRIDARKREFGQRVVVLGHHYQRDQIIQHADYRGDSYKLAKDANKHPEAEFIVFCGVHFMAESADILTPERQKVILPNMAAGCSMADMANIFQVRKAWSAITDVIGSDQKVIPVTYINSAANLKGFVGEHGGTVCTSSNAAGALEWAIGQGDKVFFFPDQHLGRNTAFFMGYDPDRDMALWDPFKPLGGLTPDKIREAKFLLWKGHCSVHKRFTVEQIEKARVDFPDVQVIVHPECELDVVRAADQYGSTEKILKTISAAAPGSTWAVGTEINLVQRLAHELADKTIFCLDPQICPCSTMYRIHPTFLLWTLDQIAVGQPTNIVSVPEGVADSARKALSQMLKLSA